MRCDFPKRSNVQCRNQIILWLGLAVASLANLVTLNKYNSVRSRRLANLGKGPVRPVPPLEI